MRIAILKTQAKSKILTSLNPNIKRNFILPSTSEEKQ